MSIISNQIALLQKVARMRAAGGEFDGTTIPGFTITGSMPEFYTPPGDPDFAPERAALLS